MNDEKWNSVLIEWVNCLKLSKNITNIEELRNGEFFSSLQKVITKSRNAQLDPLTFVFDLFSAHYPNCSFKNKKEIHLSDLPMIDLKSITSLLMHYTCIYDRKDVLTSPLCYSLSQTTQLIIRNFLQKMSKDVTIVTMNDIIKICLEDTSDHLPHHWVCVENTVSKNSPLLDLLKTPVSKFGRQQEKDRIISKLKSELETERYDKSELQEELKVQLEKNKRVERQLSQKISEISRLRAEVVSLENRTPPHYQDMDSRELQRRLRAEIQTLEQYIRQVENEQDEITKERDALNEQLKKVERQSNIWEEKYVETERNLEMLMEHSKNQEEELKELQAHCSEITALLEEYRVNPQGNDSSLFDTFSSTFSSNDNGKPLAGTPSCEDLACSVVEVQLRDMQKQNEELKMKIQESEEAEVQMRKDISEAEFKLKKIESVNEEFILQVKNLEIEKKTTEQKLEHVKRERNAAKQKTDEMMSEIESLTTEMQENHERFRDVSDEKEELLQKVQLLQAQNEIFEKRLSEALSDWEAEKKRSHILESDCDHFKVVSEKLQFELADSILYQQKIKAELMKEAEEIRKKHEILLFEAQKSSEEFIRKLDSLESENHAVKEELCKNKTNLMILEGDKAEMMLNLQEQNRNIERTERENRTTQEELYKKQTSLVTIEGEKAELLLNLQEQNEKLDTLERENHIIKEELYKNETNLMILEKEKSELALNLQEENKKFKNMEEANGRLNSEVFHLQKQLRDSQDCLETSEKRRKELEDNRKVLETQLSEAETLLEELKSKLLELKNEGLQTEARLKVIEEDSIQLTMKLNELRELSENVLKKNEELLSNNKSLQKDLLDAGYRLEVVTEQTAKLEEIKDSLKTQLHETQIILENLRVERKQTQVLNQALDESKTNTETKLQLAEELCDSFRTKYENQVASTDNLQKELELCKENIQTLTDARILLETDSETLKRDILQVELEKTELIKELDESKESLGNFEQQKMNLMSKLEESENKYNNLNDEMRKEIDDERQQVRTLLEELKMKGLESEELRNGTTVLEMRLEESQNILEKKSSELQRNKRQLKEAVSILESKEQQLDRLKERKSRIEVHMQESNKLSEKLKCELEELKTQFKLIQDECSRLKYQKSEAEFQLESFKTLLINTEVKLSDVEEYSKRQRQEIEMLELERNSVDEGLFVTVGNLQRQLSEERNSIERGKSVQKNLEQMVSDAQFDKERAENDLIRVRSENETLLLKLHDSDMVCANLEKLREEKEEIEKNLEMLKLKLDEKEKIVSESEQKNQELENERLVLTSKVARLERESEILEKQNEELKNQNSILEKLSEELRTNCSKFEGEQEKNKQEIKKLETDNENLIIKIQEVEEKSKGIERNNQALLSDNQELQQRITDLLIAFEENKKVEDSVLKEKNMIATEKDRLTEKLLDAEQKCEQVQKKYEDLILENEVLQTQISEIEISKNQIETELQAATKNLKRMEEELGVKVAEDRSIQNEELRHQISVLEREHEELKNNKETTERQLNEVSALSETLKMESEEVRIQYQKSKTELDKVRDALVKLKNEKDSVAVSLKEANEMNNSLQKEISEVKLLLIRSENENENLQQQMIDVENKNKDELMIMIEKMNRLEEEKSVLEKKMEIEEIFSSENQERVKSLEETVQDYEITISGLKTVVDANLERMEGLKEELSQRKNDEDDVVKFTKGLLKDDIVCDEKSDFKSFISENLKRLLNIKREGEEFVEKLQALVKGENEVESNEPLNSHLNNVYDKIEKILRTKQELWENLRKLENENEELNKELESLKIERAEAVKVKSEFENKKLEKMEKENILGVSTKSNKSREDELKKESMMLKRKLVLTENAKNNLEKILKELREERKKVVLPSSPSNDSLYKKLLHEYIQVKEDHERIVKLKDEQIEALTRENEQLKNNSAPLKTENKLYTDLQNIREAYGNVLNVNSKLELEIVTLRKLLEERNAEKSDLTHIKEAYERLLEENSKVMTEIDTLKYKRMRDKEEFMRLIKKEREEDASRESKRIQEIRSEYEGKLEKMKEKMLRLYREEVNKKVKSVKDGRSESVNLIRTVGNLKSELFEADQKIHLLEMEIEMLKANRKLEDTKSVQRSISHFTSVVTSDEKATTLPRSSSVTKEITISQRTSMGGVGAHNLQMEDEEDLFNDKYLTDLKEGKCALPATDRESTCRFSELAWRNSMVPPHLKSSYPAEMQFISPSRFKDEDIKTGNVEFEDSLCRLLPGEKPRKKDFGTTSYKRPGPPTPSKNGGRLSLQGNEVHPLREHCEAKTPKKSTPSRIRALFTGRNSSTRDESQSTMTPSRGKRLHFFRRPR